MIGRIAAGIILLAAAAAGPSSPTLQQRIARLEAKVATLEADVEQLRARLPKPIPGCFPYHLSTAAGAIECEVCRLGGEDK